MKTLLAFLIVVILATLAFMAITGTLPGDLGDIAGDGSTGLFETAKQVWENMSDCTQTGEPCTVGW